ncbi:Rho GDP dissociation inhibitor [Candida orthopsilosis Co 90-125]|uniref:Rho GDP dissociation inhibitor n=1 Tax=Candida orthopsilosis (strain 90-125) TaxID=1136231 RepID=H8X9R5_CANO9|nr:Rho GDP dissociation inhibitor [Candida orthopsilosis Co 90-125]CCG24731.1 Rho GDP dissociation inhibitor [Candida orthopsilosis Co 90-125]
MTIHQHPDFIPYQYVVYVEGKEEPEVVQVEGQDAVYSKIPGGVKFHQVVRFKVKNRKMENLRFVQITKKAGITFKKIEVNLGTYEPSETEIYEVKTPEDQTPGGWLTKGKYPCTTTYYEGDRELYTDDWTLELV